jgi:hypothetical protein
VSIRGLRKDMYGNPARVQAKSYACLSPGLIMSMDREEPRFFLKYIPTGL